MGLPFLINIFANAKQQVRVKQHTSKY